MNKPLKSFLSAAALLFSVNCYAEWHALVVGIDDYRAFGDLQGAVNDAEDIADALRNRPEGIQPTVLLDAKADYDTIKQWWAETAARAKPGDIVFFSMAGHGSIEAEHYPGTDNQGDAKRNDFDEVFILADFHPKGSASRQRIVDNELFGWYKKVTDKGAQIIVVADFCYGGGMTRSTSQGRNMEDKLATARNGDNIALQPEDKSKRGSLEDAMLGVSSQVFAKRLFIARPFSDENKKVLEINLNGQSRGILSYLVAKGLRGQADFNRDGITTAAELNSFLYNNSKSLSAATQDASLVPGGRAYRKKSVFSNDYRQTAATATVAPVAPVVAQQPSQSQQPTQSQPQPQSRPTLFVVGDSGDLQQKSNYYQLSDNPQSARYRWQRKKQTIVQNGVGEVAYGVRNRVDLLSFLHNQRFVDRIKQMPNEKFSGVVALASENNLDKPQTNVLTDGETVGIYLQSLSDFPYLLLINVPSKADLQFIGGFTADDLTSLPAGVFSAHVNAMIGKTEVTPPFGTDHLLILAVNAKGLAKSPLLNKILQQNTMTINTDTGDKLLQIMQNLNNAEMRMAVIPFSTTMKQ